MNQITFFVPGTPVAKGSAKAFYNRKINRAFVTQTNLEKQKPWVSLISVMAQEAGLTITDGPVSVRLEFRMPRPKSHFGKKGLKPNAPLWHRSKPDVDKLVRAVLDSLTGIAYLDDSQVCDSHEIKQYSEQPGVLITIENGELG